MRNKLNASLSTPYVEKKNLITKKKKKNVVQMNSGIALYFVLIDGRTE